MADKIKIRKNEVLLESFTVPLTAYIVRKYKTKRAG